MILGKKQTKKTFPMLGCNLKEALHFIGLIFFFEAHKTLSLNSNVLKNYEYYRFSQYISKYAKYTFLGYDFWILIIISSNKYHPSILLLLLLLFLVSHQHPSPYPTPVPQRPFRLLLFSVSLWGGWCHCPHWTEQGVCNSQFKWHGLQWEPRYISSSGKLCCLGFTRFQLLVACNI